MTEPGLDFEFLRYIGVNPKDQQQHQRFYLPFFAGCQKVIDLGCGDADFVDLLQAKGIEGIGVDSDPLACATARERGLNIVHKDVFEYLQDSPPESVDGVFSSHLIEHLPWEKVLGLLRLAYDALQPGGVIVLTTPNVRALTSHLENFYRQFGHVTFYHPTLIAFFLEHIGYVEVETGEHASPSSPNSPIFKDLPLHTIDVELSDHPVPSLFHRLVRRIRMIVATTLLRPYLDLINEDFLRVRNALLRIDRPMECYATAIKPQSPPT
jgi:SAM-dependent methyltransferase